MTEGRSTSAILSLHCLFCSGYTVQHVKSTRKSRWGRRKNWRKKCAVYVCHDHLVISSKALTLFFLSLNWIVFNSSSHGINCSSFKDFFCWFTPSIETDFICLGCECCLNKLNPIHNFYFSSKWLRHLLLLNPCVHC